VLIRDAWIWRLLCTGGENLAAASESSVSMDGHLALQTISRDEFIKARILRQTNSPGNVLSSKQLSSIRSFQWTHTQSEHHLPQTHQNLQTKPNLRTSSLQKTRDVQQNASTSSSKYQTKIFSHPFHKPYSPSHQNLRTKTNSRTTSCTENTRHATKRVPYLLATSDEEIIAPLP